MDNLAREMLLCEQAGFGASYGKWKATQPVKPIVKAVAEQPGVQKRCLRCGEAYYVRDMRGRNYCTDECRNLAWSKRKREREKNEAENARND